MSDNWTRITDDPDSLPERGVLVLCFMPPYAFGIGRRYYEQSHLISWRYDNQPTHWQPLPEPPREHIPDAGKKVDHIKAPLTWKTWKQMREMRE